MIVKQNAKNTDGVVARYWHKLPSGRIQCDLCPNHCRLREGQRGACFVRQRIGEEMVLTTYGRSSGFAIDPIEKKPLNHFLPGSPVLSFGTAGCNLTCRFCQNWTISKSREMDILADTASPELLARAAERLGCPSVAFTYNDPVIFLEYAVDVAKACHQHGVKTVAVTAGYLCEEPRREFFSAMDAANIDLKGFTESFYETVCGGRLQTVLETLEAVKSEGRCWLELTTLLIPGYNDSSTEIDAMTKWVVTHLGPEVPMHFSAFTPAYKMMDVPPTPPETLHRARRIALENGVRFAYTGNIPDPEGTTTWCSGCGAPLIRREGYRITGWNLDERGRCRSCGRSCPGVFSETPGHWGGRRQAVRLSSLY